MRVISMMRAVVVKAMAIIILANSEGKTVVILLGIETLLSTIAALPRAGGMKGRQCGPKPGCFGGVQMCVNVN
jgi:hypothetical protein